MWEFHGPRLRFLAEARPNPVHEALAHGAAVAIVNVGPTSFDVQADLRVNGDAATGPAALTAPVCT